ncbi:DUF302 domain-containing protein [Jatrophihabitans cynanchi]|uniref:DUF302 domain-containing protein n=1 Tax=Jatrophihabitans cynanchi TaxID=2944128 RepID=A0ABY7JUL0_9ACTN|nr:DUF302 domain-containing protein [Jatrophihabitans sp. SB3-54]WAX56059.1 DUF302 domain-containing protein [Jatrophihabitans sp. SB3-54]
MSDYTFGVTLDAGFTDTVQRTRAALAEQGFGVLTEIDVAATMKAKLGLDMSAHLILGACNPPLAHRALELEPAIGALLPCNVVVRTLDDSHTRVEAMNPGVMVEATGNQDLADVAEQAGTRLAAALDALAAPDDAAQGDAT